MNRRGLLIGTLVLAVLGITGAVIYHRYEGPPDARALGVPVLVGRMAYLVDGSRVILSVNDDEEPSQLTVIPAGLAFSTFTSGFGGDRILIQTGDSVYEDLGVAGNLPFTVARDGRTLLAVGLRRPGDPGPFDQTDAERSAELARVTAFDATTGTVRATTEFPGADIIDADGDWVLLQRFNEERGHPSALWNTATGAVIRFAGSEGVTPLAVTADGRVLRRVDLPGRSCYDLVTPGAVVPTYPTGYCADLDIFKALLSPDATRLLIETYDNAYLISVADFLNSHWSPTTMSFDDDGIGPTSETYWASNTTIITPSAGKFDRCGLSGRCRTFHVPQHGVVGFTYP